MEKNKVRPAISVLMSIYKEPEAWLRESIDSILSQSFRNFEFIIINDLPTRDINTELLQYYKDSDDRIKIIKNEQNIGLTKSLNKGLRAVQGKYIIRQDADDVSINNRLARQYEFMEKNTDCIVCGSNMINFKDSKKKGKLIKYPESDSDIKLYFLFKNAISHPTVIMRSEFFKENEVFYDESPQADFAEDMVLWVDIAQKIKFYNIQAPLIYHRVSPNQITKSKLQQSNVAMLAAAKKHFMNGQFDESKSVKTKIFLRAAYFFHKNMFDFKTFIKLFISLSLLLYPKIIYYIIRKHYLN